MTADPLPLSPEQIEQIYRRDDRDSALLIVPESVDSKLLGEARADRSALLAHVRVLQGRAETAERRVKELEAGGHA